MSGLEVSVNLTRVIIRETLLHTIKELHEEEGFEMGDIISELLSIASASINKPGISHNEVTVSSSGTELNEDDWDDDSDEEKEEWVLEQEAEEQFRNSDINKHIEALSEESERLTRLERHLDAVEMEENILSLLPEHAMRWNSIVGSDKYADFYYAFQADSLMKAYVVMLNTDGLDHIRNTIVNINKITDFVDQELFDMDFSRCKKDIETMKDIYEFIQHNPNFPQKNLFKELSIDGRKAVYMLNWADKLGRINRLRYKDNLLLSIVS